MKILDAGTLERKMGLLLEIIFYISENRIICKTNVPVVLSNKQITEHKEGSPTALSRGR